MGKSKKKGKKPAASVPDALAGRGSTVLTDRARDIWLAGLGAFDRTRKDGAEQFDALVARGEALRDETGEAVDDVLGRLDQVRRKATKAAKKKGRKAAAAVTGVAGTAEERIEAVVEGLLRRAGVPTRAEVQALTAQVRALEARLGKAKGGKSKAGKSKAGAAKGGASKGGAARTALVRVAPHAQGWAVLRDRRAKPEGVHATKKEALGAGRRLARTLAPSRLVVLRADGSEQEATTYGPA
jgi:poly(hydroxyalkanoate) granule-associated protein